jgi:hypothetical protein
LAEGKDFLKDIGMVLEDIACPAAPELVVMSGRSVKGLWRNLMVSLLKQPLEILVPSCDPVKPFLRSIIEIDPGGELIYSRLLNQGYGIVGLDMF